jgi:serine phosphatase RsbU (regulator of sigma subunit)
MPEVLLAAAGDLGATDVVVYLVDFGQVTLEPIADRRERAGTVEREDVATTMAGRAFVGQTPVTAVRPDGVQVWVPIVEGSDRTGVLSLTVPAETEAIVNACEELGLFAGYLIATQARATDVYNLHRRRRALSLAASMQWDLLPPLVLKTARLVVAGLVEPAYDVGGDCFDYAVDDTVLDLAVTDAMGHGVGSALISALTIGSYRHDRRRDQALQAIHANLEAVMTSHFPPFTFATGQLARIDLDSGVMTWTNAGHPLPMLIRGGRVVGEMACSPTPPWGLGSMAPQGSAVPLGTEHLEPGDSVLFYTDGVVDAHARGGEVFGVDRLADLAGQHASDQLEPEEIVRRLVGSVIQHQDDALIDDATLVLVKWNGPRPQD